MCGIFGVYSSSPLDADERKVLRTLGILNSLRGTDSTGLIRVSNNKVSFIKQVMSSAQFMLNDEVDKFIEHPSATCFVGHTRDSTIGLVNIENAHPFSYQKVIGVHNGTIRGKFENSDKFGTDSAALYKNIDTLGLEEGLNISQTDTTAYALAFIDKEKKTLNFIRNEKRPLHFTFVNESLFWSSDKEHLDIATEQYRGTRRNWDGSFKELDAIFQLPINNHLEVKLGESPLKSLRTPLKIKEIVSFYGHNRYYQDSFIGSGYTGGSTKGKGKNDLIPFDDVKIRATDPKPTPLDTMHDSFLEHILSKGCQTCGDDLITVRMVRTGIEKIQLTERAKFMCSGCVDDYQTFARYQ